MLKKSNPFLEEVITFFNSNKITTKMNQSEFDKIGNMFLFYLNSKDISKLDWYNNVNSFDFLDNSIYTTEIDIESKVSLHILFTTILTLIEESSVLKPKFENVIIPPKEAYKFTGFNKEDVKPSKLNYGI